MSASLERLLERWQTMKSSSTRSQSSHASSHASSSSSSAVLEFASRLHVEDNARMACKSRAARGTILCALENLGNAESCRLKKEYVEAINLYNTSLEGLGKSWMNGRVEYSGSVALTCGLRVLRETGAVSVSCYRHCAALALSGRGLAKLELGSWSEALFDGEAAIDSAPELAETHSRMAFILASTKMAADLAKAYVENAEILKKLKPSLKGSRESQNLVQESADEKKSSSSASALALAKHVKSGDWVNARRAALYGAGVLFGNGDDTNVYEDRDLFLERAKAIFVRKYAELREEQFGKEVDVNGEDLFSTSWLDNAFVLAGFDAMSAYDRTNVCLSIGNIFGWVGDFSGAAELYSCGLNVIAGNQNASDGLLKLSESLQLNRALCQLRAGHLTRAWKNIGKLMREECRREFASGFLRIAEVACAREEWEMAEQSFRICARLDSFLEVRHKILLSQHASLAGKPDNVDIDQLEELDKIQDGSDAEFSETPRFPMAPSSALPSSSSGLLFKRPSSFKKQNSLTDYVDDPTLFEDATQELLDELDYTGNESDSQDNLSQSKLFSGVGAQSLKMDEIVMEMEGALSSPPLPKSTRKRKARNDSCTCESMFNFLGFGSLDVKTGSVEEEILLATLLAPDEAMPSTPKNESELGNDDNDDDENMMDLDEIEPTPLKQSPP